MTPPVRRLVQSILNSVDPEPLVRRSLQGETNSEFAGILACGKAAGSMLRGVPRDVRDRAERILVVSTTECPQELLREGVRWLQADHPTPTDRSVRAGEAALEFVTTVPTNGRLLVLLSGGSSALLCLPRSPLHVGDLTAATDGLLRSGATIEELNVVRKHCEVLKGGGLAAAASGAALIVLILSDVIGDGLATIGSGPTSPDETSFADAVQVLHDYGLTDASPRVSEFLSRGVRGEERETHRSCEAFWGRVSNHIIGNNALAVDAACAELADLGYRVLTRRFRVVGSAAERGRELALAALEAARSVRGPAAIVWGGETTVAVGEQAGAGGRCQECALAAAIEIDGRADITIVTLATDGRDGPTDAAGAVVNGETVSTMRRAGVDPSAALARHDSHTALGAVSALIKTGPTESNVNDVMIALVG